MQNAAGAYELSQATLESEPAVIMCCWVEDLRIKGGSVFVQNNVKADSSMQSTIHQFKLYKEKWRLIGKRIFFNELEKDEIKETDINLFTGDVIQKNQLGDQKPVIKKYKVKKS